MAFIIIHFLLSFLSFENKLQKADQICYSVLCVFSYMAAGQEQKKSALPQKSQQSHTQQQMHQKQHNHQQHHQQQPQKTTQAQSKPTQHLPSQMKSQSIPMTQPHKPAVAVSTVQPKTSTTHTPTTASAQPSTALQKTPSLPTRPSISEQPKPNLPQLPPRVQSQGSVASRGPPPAIPPRNVATPGPVRSSSIQVPNASALNRPTLTRQTSANSIAPQCTPHPAPKFVIPQRQNSRTSMITGPHGSTGSTEAGSPPSSQQFQRRH